MVLDRRDLTEAERAKGESREAGGRQIEPGQEPPGESAAAVTRLRRSTGTLPSRLAPAAVLRLQYLAGNRAVADGLGHLAAVQRASDDEGQGHEVPPEEPWTGPQSTTKPDLEGEPKPAGEAPEAEGHEVPPDVGDHEVTSTAGQEAAPGQDQGPAPEESGTGSGPAGTAVDEPAASAPGALSAESTLPPEASPADRTRVNTFLSIAGQATSAAEGAAAGIGSFVAGLVLAARQDADRELGRLEALARPEVTRLAGIASGVLAGVRSRVATARNEAQIAIDLAVRGALAAATFVRDVVGEAHRLIAAARSGVAGAISRLRSLGSGIAGALGRLLASALSWARDQVGALLRAAGRAGGEYVRRIRQRVEQATDLVARTVGRIVSGIVGVVVAWVEQQVAAARSRVMGAAAAVRAAIARAVAVIGARAAQLESRLAARADRAVTRVVRERDRLAARGATLVRRVGPAARAAAAQLVTMVLDALGRRADHVTGIVESTRTGITEVGQSAADRAGALAAHAEALMAAVEGNLSGTVTEAAAAAEAVTAQVGEAAGAATAAARSALAAGEGLLGDLAGDARHEAEQGQAAVSRAGA